MSKIDTVEKLQEDMKLWQDEFKGKTLRIGFGGLTLLLLIFRCTLAILKRLEDKEPKERSA